MNFLKTSFQNLMKIYEDHEDHHNEPPEEFLWEEPLENLSEGLHEDLLNEPLEDS